MAGMTESYVTAVELEKVASKVPTLFERDDTFYATIEKRPVEAISSRDMRIPLEIHPGGNFGHYDPDGGSLGSGDAPFFDKAVINTAHLRHGVQWTKKAEWSTNDGRKAVLNAFRHIMAKSMAEFRRNCDSTCMTAGNGVLATPSALSAGGGTGGGDRWTFASATDGYKTRLLRYGMTVAVYDTGLTTKRAEEAKINYIDPANGIVDTLAVGGTTVTGAQATDKFLISGLSGATPASIYGVPYHHSSASSGYWLGLNRATYPEIRANSVNAAGALALPYPRLAINKLGERLGQEAVGKLKAWMHPCQKHAYEELGQLVSVINKNAKDDALNMYFGDNMQMAGVPVETHYSWDRTRIDFINSEVWGRAELKPAGLYDVEGRKLFESRNASGEVLTSQLFFIVASFNLFVNNPAACAYIYGLSIPSGY